MEKRPLGYLGGDIMTHGSNLARQYEYDKFIEAEIPVDIYSPIMNKSINDKSNVTEEENNHLAEKIVAADVERLWNSDFTVLSTEQSAIGTMCEMGILYGWKYMADKILEAIQKYSEKEQVNLDQLSDKECAYILKKLFCDIIEPQYNKKNYAHYFDIRTNHLNEKDWRRSFGMNQFLYGIILAATADGQLHNHFDEIIPILKKEYGKQIEMDFDSTDWR